MITFDMTGFDTRRFAMEGAIADWFAQEGLEAYATPSTKSAPQPTPAEEMPDETTVEPMPLTFGPTEPSCFYEYEEGVVYRGQDRAKRLIDSEIGGMGADERFKCFLSGPAGTGKTSLAMIIAKRIARRWEDLGVKPGPFFMILPSTLHSREMLDGFMRQLVGVDRAVVFFDEVHQLGANLEVENLFRVLDDTGKAHYTTADGELLEIPGTVCFIAATTDAGRADNTTGQALLRRFDPLITLDAPDTETLAAIAHDQEMPIAGGAALEMGRRADGLPWRLLSILKRARNVARGQGAERIEMEHAMEAFDMLGIDEYGLDTMERAVIYALMEMPGYRTNEGTVCSAAGVDKKMFKERIQKKLLARKFMHTTGGQNLAEAGARAYGTPEFVAEFLRYHEERNKRR